MSELIESNLTTPYLEVYINTTSENAIASGNNSLSSGGDTSITAAGNLTLQGATINLN